jgi:hypothetical protein
VPNSESGCALGERCNGHSSPREVGGVIYGFCMPADA